MRMREGWERWGDWTVAVALVAAAGYQYQVGAAPHVTVSGGRPLVAVMFGAVTLAPAWRRLHPVAVVFVVTGAFVVAGLLATYATHGPLAVFLALILAFYSVGAHSEDRRAIVAGGAALAALAASDLAGGLFGSSPSPGAWLLLAFAWLVGREVRRRRRELVLLREQAARLVKEREEEARAAVAMERSRIARELHDVVAHSVSVIVVQAQAGPRLLGEGEQVRRTFRSIETSGREALVELRRLLGILRTDDEQLAIGPQPGLDSLQMLVEQLRRAGLPVDVRIEGEPTRLPPGIDLSAYRIVQEALTNALKHAGDASVEVVLRYGAFVLELDIRDNGRGARGNGDGSGHGLIGMRERVALYGGEVEAGAGDDHGYAVRARLPLVEGRR
jgi:signal transduction histidine kinase